MTTAIIPTIDFGAHLFVSVLVWGHNYKVTSLITNMTFVATSMSYSYATFYDKIYLSPTCSVITRRVSFLLQSIISIYMFETNRCTIPATA
jgi:hypothetical protein